MTLADANKYFNKFSKNLDIPNHRYLSWEHCYNFFKLESNSKSKKSPDFERLSLHLAFYLASWGMYRGKCKLLQKDYFIHLGTIYILFQSKYDSLWGKEWKDYNNDQKDFDLLFDLIENLRKYHEQVKIPNTDTLITKIIKGTMGCIPAYDRYFKKGLKNDTITQKLGKESFKQIIDKYGTTNFKCPTHSSSIYSGLNYPQMKIIDCIFWERGQK